MKTRLNHQKENVDNCVIYAVRFIKDGFHCNATLLKLISNDYFWIVDKVSCVGDWEYILNRLDAYAGQKITDKMFCAILVYMDK